MNADLFGVGFHIGMHALITESMLQIALWLVCASVHD